MDKTLLILHCLHPYSNRVVTRISCIGSMECIGIRNRGSLSRERPGGSTQSLAKSTHTDWTPGLHCRTFGFRASAASSSTKGAVRDVTLLVANKASIYVQHAHKRTKNSHNSTVLSPGDHDPSNHRQQQLRPVRRGHSRNLIK